MFGNIYQSKNYKLMVIVPLALLLISLYFIPHIPLDSSLRGGITLQLQTNTSTNAQQITSALDAKIPGAQASVSQASGGISITLAANQSLANGQQQLLNSYGYYNNYSTWSTQVAGYQNALRGANATNATLEGLLSAAQANQTKALTGLAASTAQITATLKPLLSKTYSYNQSNAQQMLNVAKNEYSNASTAYQTFVVNQVKNVVPFTSYTYQDVTPTLGAFFLQQMQGIIIASFIIVAICVFLLFRTPVPAFAVVFGAGNDIIVALGAMGLFGIPLGVASIGGLLMLIGYSIDTDMLAAIRIIKRAEGTPSERAFSTMKTGMTMTFAAIISFSILLIIAYLTFIPTYLEIASVVLFGLITDLFTTWFGNTPMILWWKQRKEVQ